MCIYCGTTKYRKIYENHYGKIPKDETNRSYEIHHIDGDHSNNNYDNLKAVSLKEHYYIHYHQKDYGACFLLAQKMKVSPQVLSELNKLQNCLRISEGTHNLIKRPDGTSHASDRVSSGNHHFLKRKDGGSLASDRVKSGTHPFLKRNCTFKPSHVDPTIYIWTHKEKGIQEKLTVREFITKYNLENNQGNISGLIRGKFNKIKGWTVIR